MSSPKVLIIGCGVAGPAIALLLKRKGYEPIVLEKVRKLGEAGGSLMMMPNGIKVLSLLGLDEVVTKSGPHCAELRDKKSSGEDLGVSYLPARWKEKYGQPACGVKRTTLNLALKNELESAQIVLREGWQLKDIIEKESGVVATAVDGRIEEGSFLIGCDGIKSVTRTLVLAQHGLLEEQASFTGLTQAGGLSPTPDSLISRPGMLNIYGPAAHFICYPITPTMTAWAFTQKASMEFRETWNISSAAEKLDLEKQLLEEFKDWKEPIAEIIRGTDKLIKFGLYDRPHLEPEQWYSKDFSRCLLIGDAAHPTSPHLGQGANQAFEDCYHLSRLLPDFGKATSLSTSDLKKVFGTFATLRQPRTAALVRAARVQGEDRVVDGGLKACEERDERLRQKWKDEAAVEERYDSLLREPF